MLIKVMLMKEKYVLSSQKRKMSLTVKILGTTEHTTMKFFQRSRTVWRHETS